MSQITYTFNPTKVAPSVVHDFTHAKGDDIETVSLRQQTLITRCETIAEVRELFTLDEYVNAHESVYEYARRSIARRQETGERA